jgi:hypothetical protein
MERKKTPQGRRSLAFAAEPGITIVSPRRSVWAPRTIEASRRLTDPARAT